MKADNDALMAAARKATEVLEEFEARKRIEAGYTRIDPERIASASDMIRSANVFLTGGAFTALPTLNWRYPTSWPNVSSDFTAAIAVARVAGAIPSRLAAKACTSPMRTWRKGLPT